MSGLRIFWALKGLSSSMSLPPPSTAHAVIAWAQASSTPQLLLTLWWLSHGISINSLSRALFWESDLATHCQASPSLYNLLNPGASTVVETAPSLLASPGDPPTQRSHAVTKVCSYLFAGTGSLLPLGSQGLKEGIRLPGKCLYPPSISCCHG